MLSGNKSNYDSNIHAGIKRQVFSCAICLPLKYSVIQTNAALDFRLVGNTVYARPLWAHRLGAGIQKLVLISDGLNHSWALAVSTCSWFVAR